MKVLQGKVVSNKMQKTAVVEVTRKVAHPLYKKILKKSKKYKADTGEFSVSIGDVVLIEETKPVSKGKYFRVSKVLVRVQQIGSVDEKHLTTENTEKVTEDTVKSSKRRLSRKSTSVKSSESRKSRKGSKV